MRVKVNTATTGKEKCVVSSIFRLDLNFYKLCTHVINQSLVSEPGMGGNDPVSKSSKGGAAPDSGFSVRVSKLVHEDQHRHFGLN